MRPRLPCCLWLRASFRNCIRRIFYGVRSGAFCCKLSGSDWFMLGCAMTGGR